MKTVFFLILVTCLAFGSECNSAEVPQCTFAGKPGTPLVNKLEDIPTHSYGRPGLAHMTIAGAVHHGMKEVEVWMQSFAPGSGTPIHQHDCEEIFVVLGGSGTVFTAGFLSTDMEETPGTPRQSIIASNTTFIIPRQQIHKVQNTAVEGTLQLLVVISRPPIHVYAYETWDIPHKMAKHLFPYPWDSVCPEKIRDTVKNEL